jgi:cytochrome c peroxidase
MKISGIALFIVIIGLMSRTEGLFEYPSYFPKPIYNFRDHPLDSTKIRLGRILFYDPILSKDNSISCASCHSPYNAFAHTDHSLSHGIFDSIGNRNAPALFNLAWQENFMWDGAINHLDMQALAPIAHPGEMGSNLAEVVSKLKDSPSYVNLFYKAFKDSTITGAKVLKSLSQFQLTLISANAKYDKVQEGKQTFNEQEANGYLLFKRNCNTCHTEPLFSSYQFANNGLPLDTTLKDLGRWQITSRREDSLYFKIPSLRNLSFSYPYMHDGRFNHLREVLDHYASDLSDLPNISKELKEQKIKLTSREKIDLIAFLLTLNDSDFVFNKNHHFQKL